MVRGVSWSDFEETQPIVCLWMGLNSEMRFCVFWVLGLGVCVMLVIVDLGREGKMHEGYWGVLYEQICVQK